MRSHVLIVDDSFTVRMDLRALLSGAGFLATACANAAAARAALRARPYDLVVLDVVLPGGHGIDLLREIKDGPESSRMPVILLSTEAEVPRRMRGLALGADEYVGKPYDKDHLVRCARTLVSARDTGPVSSERRGIGKKRILIVDDSAVYLHALSTLLREDGYSVVTATSGEDALGMLQIEQVDAIVLDLLMPGIDGFETCRRIRSNPRLQHLPVMMLTGREDEGAQAAGVAAGVDEFVVKSPALELIRVRLRTLIREKRVEQEGRVSGELSASGPASSRRSAWRGQVAMPAGSLLYRVAMATSLADVIGPATLSGVCRRAGVDVKNAGVAELTRALPKLSEDLRMFLSVEERERLLPALERALSGAANLDRVSGPGGTAPPPRSDRPSGTGLTAPPRADRPSGIEVLMQARMNRRQAV